MRRATRVSLLPLLLLLVAPAPAALAQDSTGGLIERPTGFDDSSFVVDILGGWKTINTRGSEPDAFEAGIASTFRFSRWVVAIEVGIPIAEGDIALRSDEWNELRDWFHILRQLQYGRKGEPFFFRLGELTGFGGTLGHGTIVRHYQSGIDYNSPATGLQIDTDFGGFGTETLINSVTDWNLTSIRGYMRPLRLSRPEDADLRARPAIEELTIGATLAIDWSAPDVLSAELGEPAVDGSGNIRSLNEMLAIVGFDIEIPVVNTDALQLVPYADWVQVINHGGGVFAGVNATIELPPWDLLPLELTAEFIATTRGFIPAYFDSHYEVERYGYPSLEAATTKLDALHGATPTTGFRVGASWGVDRLVRFTVSYSDYFDDPDNAYGRLVLGVATVPDDTLPFDLEVIWQKRGVESVRAAFALDERALLTANLLISVPGLPVRAGLRMERSWIVDQGIGRYKPVDVWYPWLSLAFAF